MFAAAIGRIMQIPVSVSGDQKSIGILLGTSTASNAPCSVCTTTKELKLDVDRKKYLVNFDKFFSQEWVTYLRSS